MSPKSWMATLAIASALVAVGCGEDEPSGTPAADEQAATAPLTETEPGGGGAVETDPLYECLTDEGDPNQTVRSSSAENLSMGALALPEQADEAVVVEFQTLGDGTQVDAELYVYPSEEDADSAREGLSEQAPPAISINSKQVSGNVLVVTQDAELTDEQKDVLNRCLPASL